MAPFDLGKYKIDPSIQKKLDILNAIAAGDKTYQQMFEAYQELEKRFFSTENNLPPDDRDIIWDYFGMSEAMTHRLTELACLYMEFPRTDSNLK